MRSVCVVFAALWLFGPAVLQARPADRLAKIRQRGFVTCGVAPEIPGFASVDDQGRYSGLDVDICRAYSAVIFGTPDQVSYRLTSNVREFLQSDDIDVVSRRLTWELRREGARGLLFGPVTFYDGQGFLVARRLAAHNVPALAAARICVAPGSGAAANLAAYFRARQLSLRQESLPAGQDLGAAFAAGRCDAYTADVSALGAIRIRLPNPADFEILAQQISKEPLAQLVRQGDDGFYAIVRWTVFALIGAEELGVTSQNVDAMLHSDDPAIQLLLGVVPGNGAALGLDEKWAYDAIKTLGNYSEIFERNLGASSRIGLARGLNRLWTDGGLMYAPPLR